MLPSHLRRRPALAWWLGLAVAAIAAFVLVRAVDPGVLGRSWRAATTDPVSAGTAVAAFAAAFALRAVAWRRVLPGLSFRHALAAIHVSLGGNHVLPARLGEVLRVTSVVRRAGIGLDAAAASTLTLRAADIASLALLATVFGAGVLLDLGGAWGVLVVLGVAAVGLGGGLTWLRRLQRSGRVDVRLPGAGVAALTLLAWVLEAAVVHRAASWAGVELGYGEAILVTALTVAGQLVALSPGGFGTYEAVGTAALVAVGVDAGTGLAIALTAHAVKTAYSLLTGAVALLLPSPGMLGHVRLPGRCVHGAGTAVPDGPVVLFVPAHDERAAIADVIARVPGRVHGREVRFLVVDDGSTDDTVVVARDAGAEVVSQPENRGLGAAVRRGFDEALARDAAVVVFCDADGEYAPEELARVVAPILAGEADYVVGSRFAGEIQRMLPHRRFGNRVLTLLLRFVARTPITDGQSGYRALSREAARRAEIIHDFNYAQVLTLDLLAKGFRYAEVPISYRFRATGTSFVRLGRYLRAVVPAVWREVNEVPTGA